MANRYWVGGANNGTWNDVNNWSASRGGAGGSSVPTTGDSFWIEDTSQSIAGYAANVVFASGTVTFGGSLGDSSTSFTAGFTGTLTIRTSNGTHYIAPYGALGSGNEIIAMNVQSTGNGKVYVGGSGGVTTLYAGPNTQVSVGASVVVTTYSGAGVTDAAANGTAITTANVAGGTLTCSRGITTANVAGTLVTKGNAAAVATANVFPDGVHTNLSSSTVTNSNVWPGGRASAKGSPYSLTVTNRISYEGSENYIDSANVTFTNSATIIGQQSV